MKRLVLVSGLVVCAALVFATRGGATPPGLSDVVTPGGIYEVSFCTGGRVVSEYSEGWPINIKVTEMLGDGWVEAEWGNTVKKGLTGTELVSSRPHQSQRFNLNMACAISPAIK